MHFIESAGAHNNETILEASSAGHLRSEERPYCPAPYSCARSLCIAVGDGSAARERKLNVARGGYLHARHSVTANLSYVRPKRSRSLRCMVSAGHEHSL